MTQTRKKIANFLILWPFLAFSRHKLQQSWHEWAGWWSVNAIESPKTIEWNLTKDLRWLSSHLMTQVASNILNCWQRLIKFSSSETPIWKLVLGQFWHSKARYRATDSIIIPSNLSLVHAMIIKGLSIYGILLIPWHKPSNAVRCNLKLLINISKLDHLSGLGLLAGQNGSGGVDTSHW